jgi:membrane associated rhomboid family serine protease
MYPQRRVRVLWLYQVMQVPAILAIGIWFLFQLISSAGTLGASGGGVAYGAHIGGFIAGSILIANGAVSVEPIKRKTFIDWLHDYFKRHFGPFEQLFSARRL